MNEKNLDILVIDDKVLNLASIPLLTDAGHSVDTAENFIEAVKLLGYRNEQPKKYDAVLTDLMLPLGGDGGEFVGLAEDWQRNEEQPLGYAISLYAAKRNVPLIGMFTDMNHHSSPVAATFDVFYTKGRERQVFNLNGSKFIMFDERDLGSVFLTTDLKPTTENPHRLPKEEAEEKFYTARNRYGDISFATSKNWKAVLEKLTEQ